MHGKMDKAVVDFVKSFVLSHKGHFTNVSEESHIAPEARELDEASHRFRFEYPKHLVTTLPALDTL